MKRSRMMCLYSLLKVVVTLGLVSTLVSEVVAEDAAWNVRFIPEQIKSLAMNNETLVHFTTSDLSEADVKNGVVTVVVSNPDIASANATFTLNTEVIRVRNWTSSFNVTGVFLGYSNISLVLNDPTRGIARVSSPLSVIVVRERSTMYLVFVHSVAILVTIIYINFGCVVDWEVLKQTVKRPIGPMIGFLSQFLVMPVLSYFLGKVLFPDSVPMQLGLFFTGVSPAGGASNIWTFLLGGNLNLSITMTAISTIAAFAMMPLWIFTLGRLIFDQGELGIPYERIGTFALCLVIPLALGLVIQKYLPRVSKVMTRILKPFSTLLILFIVIFAIVTNLYMFKLFTWKIVIAGFGLPCIGYLCGMCIARLSRQPPEDVLAISIETGIQNTGIAIFLLTFSLKQPEADLTTVVPVAVAMMTPIPLLCYFIFKKCQGCYHRKSGLQLRLDDKDSSNVHLPINGSNR